MVTASRNFVCVRPQTYEDKEEAELLTSLFEGRSGVLENTVFCVLAPDGKRTLTRAGRSPQSRWDKAEDFAGWLDRTFEAYARKAKALEALPLHESLALGLNVAACDLAPLAILSARNEKDLRPLVERAAQLAWSEEHVGRQHFVTCVGKEQLAQAKEEFGLDLEPGLTLVQPDPYGRAPRVLAAASARAKREKDSDPIWSQALSEGRAAHDPEPKSRRRHLRDASRQGITWDSELPVTDPGEREARERRERSDRRGRRRGDEESVGGGDSDEVGDEVHPDRSPR